MRAQPIVKKNLKPTLENCLMTEKDFINSVKDFGNSVFDPTTYYIFNSSFVLNRKFYAKN